MKTFFKITTINDMLIYLLSHSTSYTLNFDDDEFYLQISSPNKNRSKLYIMKYKYIQSVVIRKNNKIVIRGRCRILFMNYDPVGAKSIYKDSYELEIENSFINNKKMVRYLTAMLGKKTGLKIMYE